jgi:purine-binding chemotaxis protein CheW
VRPEGGAEQAQQILRQRAEMLARPVIARERQDTRQTLRFSVAGQRCALDLRWLREVRPLRGLSLLPLAAAPALGIVHLRGRMLAVLDLARLLGLQPGEREGGDLIVVGRDAARLAFVAEVDSMADDAIDDARRRSAELTRWPAIVSGMTASGHLLLDGEGLLALHTPAPAPAAAPAFHHFHGNL